MQTLYQLVGLKDVSSKHLMTREELDATGLVKSVGDKPDSHLRPELRNQPELTNMCGGMWGGWYDEDGKSVYPVDDKNPNGPCKPYGSQKPITAFVVRYETWAAYEALSR